MNNRNQLLASIKKLRNTKYVTFMSIDKSILENEEELSEYFEAPFDSESDKMFEKMVSTAVIRSTYASSAIPGFLKEAIAQNSSRKIVEALRYAKLDYKYETETITAKEYQTRIKENEVAQRMAVVKACIKKAVFEATKLGIAIGVGVITAALEVAALPATVVGYITWGVITVVDCVVPPKVKEKVKQGIRNAKNACVSMAQKAVKRLEQATEKVAKVVEPIIEKAANTLEKVGKTVKKKWEETKEKTKQLYERFKFW